MNNNNPQTFLYSSSTTINIIRFIKRNVRSSDIYSNSLISHWIILGLKGKTFFTSSVDLSS